MADFELEFHSDGSRRLVEADANGGAQPDVPIASAGFTIDTTTYDDIITGTGKLTTVIFPANGALLALAIEGDAYPRMIFEANGIIDLGDGASDPTDTGGTLSAVQQSGTGGNAQASALNGSLNSFTASVDSTNTDPVNESSGPLKLEHSGVILQSGAGVPARGGNVGDLYIRTDPSDVNSYLYRCTVAGIAGAATWVPLGGLT